MRVFCIWGVGAWVGWCGRGFGATQLHLSSLVMGDQLIKSGVKGNGIAGLERVVNVQQHYPIISRRL